MATLSLNTAARGLDRFSGATKMRAHLKDGVLFVRPTHRASNVNLKKGIEFYAPIVAGKVEIEGLEVSTGTFGVAADKYGWFALTPEHQGRGPSVKIA